MGATLPSEALAAIAAGQAIVCTTQCYPCQFGQHEKPKRWHTWADADDIEHALKAGQPDPSKSRCGCPCADRLPEVLRPNGKPYRPRSLRVDYIDDEDNLREDYPAKTVVLGTHDVEVARRRVDTGRVCHYLINPRTAWLRLGFESGRMCWIDDDVRGAACVVFDESDDPPEAVAALRGDTP